MSDSAWPRVPGVAPTLAGQAQVAAAATAAADAQRVVMPLYANVGFMPFLKNLLCSVARIGTVENHFVVAVDNQTCGVLAQPFGLAATPPRCVHPYEGHGAANRSKAGADRYKSSGFNAIMIHRVAWNLFLLGRGFSIMHCDLDIVWLHDPRPVFASPQYRDTDMLLQSEQVYGYNGGFYLARARPSVVAGVRAWMAELVHTWETRPKKFEEQHSLVSRPWVQNGAASRASLTQST
tara:strand:+ start:903 stop:1610 length:708 start_codon:yes stop_codon:yes gene_type:complete